MNLDTTRNILLRLFAECGGKNICPRGLGFSAFNRKNGGYCQGSSLCVFAHEAAVFL